MKNNNFNGNRRRPMSAGQRAFEARRAARAAKQREEQNAAAIAWYNTRRHFTSAELKSMPVDKFIQTWLHVSGSQAKFDVQMVTTELLRRARKCGMPKDCLDTKTAFKLLEEKALNIRRIPFNNLLDKCRDFVAGVGALDFNETPTYYFEGESMTDNQRDLYRSWIEKMFMVRVDRYLKNTNSRDVSMKHFQIGEFLEEFDAMDKCDREKYAVGYCSPETINYVARFAKSKYGNGSDVTDVKSAYAYVSDLRFHHL